MPDDPNGTAVTPTGSAARTGTQGLSVAALLELLTAFNVIALTSRQTAAVLVVGTALASFLQRVIEARVGKAWLRTVPAKP